MGAGRREQLEKGKPYSSLPMLIVAISEGDDKTIRQVLSEEVYNLSGDYEAGLELRRLDEYEILIYGTYDRSEDIERGFN